MSYPPIPDRLIPFDSYEDFVTYCNDEFNLNEEEISGLYNVLLKLQGIGQDPIQTMEHWKKHTCETDCSDFIRFMIQIDTMDLEKIKETIS